MGRGPISKQKGPMALRDLPCGMGHQPHYFSCGLPEDPAFHGYLPVKPLYWPDSLGIDHKSQEVWPLDNISASL